MSAPLPKQDPSKNLEKWFVFPDMLQDQQWRGFQNKYDVTRNRGAFVIGQNITFGDTGNPTLRSGFEVVGSEAADATPVKRGWTYETRDGVQFTLKAYDTFVYYFLHGVSTSFALLKSGFTSGLEFGYGNIGKTADATNHTIFCNGTDDWYRFNGAYATVASVTANTITKSGATTWTAIGAYSTGTRSFIINGTEFAYTGGEGTTTLTGVTPDPSAAGITVDMLAVQSPQVVAALSALKGSVVMAHDGRLHARLDTKPSVWDYSKLDDPFDWTAGNTDSDGGAKEVEFGGPIVAYGKLNKKILCFKKRLIKSLEFLQFGSRVDSPRYDTLTSTDDKSTSLGATNQKSTFSSPYGMILVTPSKRLALLTGVTQNNEPLYTFLSDPIEPVFTQGVHDQGTGIFADNYLWYAFKSDNNSTYNDVVVRCDMSRYAQTGRFVWDAPYVGWNVNDFSIAFNATTNRNDVYFHSSINSTTYRIIPDKLDAGQAFTTTLRSHAETFGSPNDQKLIDRAFVEIYMLENSEILATLLYDEDGVSGQVETTLLGTDSDNLFDSSTYNPFGASSFGSQKIGSNPNIDDLKKYRFELEVKPNTRLFNLSLQLSEEEANSDYELVRYGYRLKEVCPEIERKFKKSIS